MVNQIKLRKPPFKIMNILKISIIVAILGLIGLFFITRVSSEQVISIEDLKIGQMERITGMVTSSYVSREGHTFLKVADNTGEIKVVAFEGSNIEIAPELEVGDEVSVFGKVEEYKGEMEIIANDIRKV